MPGTHHRITKQANEFLAMYRTVISFTFQPDNLPKAPKTLHGKKPVLSRPEKDQELPNHQFKGHSGLYAFVLFQCFPLPVNRVIIAQLLLYFMGFGVVLQRTYYLFKK